LTLIFNVILSYYILGTTVSKKGLVSCGIVFVGYVVASIGEMSVTIHGLVYGNLSSIFVALYSIYVKDKLQLLGNNQWKLMQYNTLLAVILLFPFTFLSGEMVGVMTFEHLLSPMFWSTMTFAAVMGLFINIAIFMQIKYTSPLTNTISGTAKACLQTLLGVYIFGNDVSPLNAFGTLVCIGGSAYYSLVRYQEMMSK
jgi:solute carrier family 35 (GDP-fucose transporter), member C1